MTTWEPASDAEARLIRELVGRLRRAGLTVPVMPSTFDAEDYSRLTRRDAGKVIASLREALEDAEQRP